MRLTLCAPPVTPAALLVVHVRRQLGPVQLPHHLRARRVDLPPGVNEATLEDFDDYNDKTLTLFPSQRHEIQTRSASFEGLARDKPIPSRSLMNEHEWLRITHCYNPWLDAKIKIRIFDPGMLDGLWSGRIYVRRRFLESNVRVDI